ncbi:glycerophosphodiester phosphodiesterase, partial [Calditrichota bacterium]
MRLIAHRGGLYYRPENTMAAFGNILGAGIEWIECDVRMSADGVPILFHDDTLDIDGNGVRLVSEMTREQLMLHDVGGGEGVPSLEDLFTKFHDVMCFDVELKEIDTAEVTMKLIDRFDVVERCMITSFIPDALQICRDLNPDVARGFLVDRLTGNLVDIKSTVKAAKLLECVAILPH